MKPPSLAGLVHVGLDVLSTAINSVTKKITAQTGDAVSQSTDANGIEWWQHVGFVSRPAKPTAGKAAAQCVVLKTSDRDAAIASQDLRGLELYGALDHGEFCVYATGVDGMGQARIFGKKDGSLHLYTKKGNTASGAGMTIQIDPTAGAIRLINDKGYGIVIDANGVKITAGASGLSLGGDGSAKLIATAQAQVDGASICIGSVAVPGVNSALTGVTGVSGKASLKTVIE